MARLVFTILGCGSSGGVPRIGGHWGDCDPNNPKNRRRRCSMLVQRFDHGGETSVLIDTTPDMQSQLVDAGQGVLDAVLYTHSHADHVHGLDDLRQVVFNTGRRLPVWADGPTSESLLSRFSYAFVQPAGSAYPPILDLHVIQGPIEIEGEGGKITFVPFSAAHGTIDALGFRIGPLSYLPDAVDIYPDAWQILAGTECFVVDALRRKPHPTHAHLALALEWIERLAPRQAVLTNMHIDLDYAQLLGELPETIRPAYDGMRIEFDLPD